MSIPYSPKMVRDYAISIGCELKYAELLAKRYTAYRKERMNENETFFTIHWYVDYTLEWDIARGFAYYDKKSKTYKAKE